MITILSMLEKGYESSFEHLTFRQLRGAYKCKLICIPHDFATLQEGLDAAVGVKIFMVPPGRVDHSTEFSEFILPYENVVFVFGSPQENLVKYIGDNKAIHITTKGSSDMMAVCVAAMVLYVHG
jgi:hypothetical protein